MEAHNHSHKLGLIGLPVILACIYEEQAITNVVEDVEAYPEEASKELLDCGFLVESTILHPDFLSPSLPSRSVFIGELARLAIHYDRIAAAADLASVLPHRILSDALAPVHWKQHNA